MDPVTRYQAALHEVMAAASGLFHPAYVAEVSRTVTTLARAADVPAPKVRVAQVTEALGDPLVP